MNMDYMDSIFYYDAEKKKMGCFRWFRLLQALHSRLLIIAYENA